MEFFESLISELFSQESFITDICEGLYTPQSHKHSICYYKTDDNTTFRRSENQRND